MSDCLFSANRDERKPIALIVNSLKAQDSREAQGRDTTVVDAMTLALGRGGLSTQPSTEAMLLRTISDILYENGGAAEAEAPAERAVLIERSLHTGDHPDLALSLRNLGQNRRARGRYVEAEATLRESLGMFERLNSGDSENVAENLSALA